MQKVPESVMRRKDLWRQEGNEVADLDVASLQHGTLVRITTQYNTYLLKVVDPQESCAHVFSAALRHTTRCQSGHQGIFGISRHIKIGKPLRFNNRKTGPIEKITLL